MLGSGLCHYFLGNLKKASTSSRSPEHLLSDLLRAVLHFLSFGCFILLGLLLPLSPICCSLSAPSIASFLGHLNADPAALEWQGKSRQDEVLASFSSCLRALSSHLVCLISSKVTSSSLMCTYLPIPLPIKPPILFWPLILSWWQRIFQWLRMSRSLLHTWLPLSTPAVLHLLALCHLSWAPSP